MHGKRELGCLYCRGWATQATRRRGESQVAHKTQVGKGERGETGLPTQIRGREAMLSV